ncbi:acyl carrier protein [Terriglobus sp.]|uniref:acyl carrier protein n=1 Tax=Terriglobus sp. TaxID=1889013 RepID=UPI003B002F3F
MSQPVPSSLRDLVADTLEIAPEDVTPELNTETAENWDSFRHLQLMLAVEGEYGVQFDPSLVAHLTTVAAIQDALQKKGVTL